MVVVVAAAAVVAGVVVVGNKSRPVGEDPTRSGCQTPVLVQAAPVRMHFNKGTPWSRKSARMS